MVGGVGEYASLSDKDKMRLALLYVLRYQVCMCVMYVCFKCQVCMCVLDVRYACVFLQCVCVYIYAYLRIHFYEMQDLI